MIMRNSVILVDQIEHDVASGASPLGGDHRSDGAAGAAGGADGAGGDPGHDPATRSVFWGPMAVAIMGGLIVATFLTLLFLPGLYALWFRRSLDRTPAAQPQGGGQEKRPADVAPEPPAVPALAAE